VTTTEAKYLKRMRGRRDVLERSLKHLYPANIFRARIQRIKSEMQALDWAIKFIEKICEEE
jgi:hypothetical protein